MYDQFSFLPRNMSSYLVHLVLRSELNHHSKECNWNERRKLVFNSPSKRREVGIRLSNYSPISSGWLAR